MNHQDHFTLQQAADQLGITKRGLWNNKRSGRIRFARHELGTLCVTRHELERFRAERQKRLEALNHHALKLSKKYPMLGPVELHTSDESDVDHLSPDYAYAGMISEVLECMKAKYGVVMPRDMPAAAKDEINKLLRHYMWQVTSLGWDERFTKKAAANVARAVQHSANKVAA